MTKGSTSTTCSTSSSSQPRGYLPAHPRSGQHRAGDARPRDRSHLRLRARFPIPSGTRRPSEAADHRRARRHAADVSRIAAQNAKSVITDDHPRRRARADLRGVRRPHRRERDRHGAAVRQPLHAHQAARGRRGASAAERAAQQRALRPQPAHQGLHHRRAQGTGQRALDRRVAHAPRPHPPPLRDRGARGLRRHRRDQERRSRAGRPQQGRGLQPRAGPRPGRRVRRPQGQPRAHGRGRASRRAYRRRAVERGRRRPTWPRRSRPPRSTASSSTRTRTPRRSSRPTTSSRLPSARRARTRVLPPSSPAGASTSRARRWPPSRESRPPRPALRPQAPRSSTAVVSAVTTSGVRCRNQARPGSYYCGVHEKEAAAE